MEYCFSVTTTTQWIPKDFLGLMWLGAGGGRVLFFNYSATLLGIVNIRAKM